MTTATTPKTHLRWALRRDLPRMARIDAAGSWSDHWTEEQMLERLRRKNEIAMVIQLDEPDCEDVVGFMHYRLEPDRIVLLKLVVHPNYRGQGFGTQLLEKLRYKLTSHRRELMVLSRELLTVQQPDGSEWPMVGKREWLSTDVLTLLNGDDQPPLYLLADALQEAGCDDENWLTPFRREGRFARAMYGLFFVGSLGLPK